MSRRIYAGSCPVCGKNFESSRKKKFCSNKCRANSPDFIAVAKRNAVNARAAHAAKARKQRLRRCDQCGQEFEAQPASTQRFCSRGCARRYRATQFDDLVAVLDTVPRLSNFDEFLSGDVLECPIEGCYWHGEDLGQHISQGHGIPAARFKEKAGFNKHTGLVGCDLSRRLANRNRGDSVPPGAQGPAKGTKLAREGREHFDKAMLLRRKATAGSGP